MEWEIQNKERISDKLAVEIFASIISGAIPAGSRLPTLEMLLKKTNASIETLRKALRVLIDWQVIFKTRRGYFVTEDISAIHAARQNYIEQATTKYKADLSKMACKSEIRLELLEV